MKPNNSVTISGRLASIGYALNGWRLLLKREPNTRLHLAATIVVLAAAVLTGLSKTEWLAIVFAIAMVWLAEGFNTCIELFCDLYCGGQYNRAVGIVKDIAAGVVLLASVASLAIGIIVFFL
ncbi:MAG: diacylglycerol kinase family protein [Flavipsychrobacter sp.]|nr:diacylglycerol kinase family protein [Flavipsychrobacter sp.]